MRYTKPGLVFSTTTAVASVGTSFDAAKYHKCPLGNVALYELNSILIKLSSISGASALEYVITEDAAGDKILIVGTALDIRAGVTTATVGACEDNLQGATVYATDMYIFFKTDAGTVTVESVQFSVTGV
jgi:hypothetical protein